MPDPVTMRVVEERFAQPDARSGAVLDGFPRTRPQAEALDRLAGPPGRAVAAALYIEVDTPELVQRLAGRRVCTGVRAARLSPRPRARRAVAGVCDIDGTPLEQRADDRPRPSAPGSTRQLPPMYEVVDHYAETGVLTPSGATGPWTRSRADLLRVAERAAKRA